MKRLAQILVSLAFAWSSADAQSSFEAISRYTAGSVNAFTTGTGGWIFQPQVDMSVTNLGCLQGLVSTYGPVNIGLWADQGGVLLASTVIQPTNTLFNGTRYATISPVPLSSGHLYRIGAYAPGGLSLNLIGPPPDYDGSVTLSPYVSLVGSALITNGFMFPSSSGPSGTLLLGANFRFSANVVYSPPPTLSITNSGTNSVIVSWPLPANGWVLEQTAALVPTISWAPISPPYQTNSSRAWIVVSPAVGNRFYRLYIP